MRTTIAILWFWIFCVTMSNAAFAYTGGSGTPDDPYQISTVTDWAVLTIMSGDWGKHFILIKDIDLSGTSLGSIGTRATPFRGILNGKGHVVRNGIIYQPNTDEVGLFGYIEYGCHILNFGAENLAITGRSSVGGLVAINNGGTVIGCHVNGSVTGSQSNIGGLVAVNYWGTVQSSFADVTVKTNVVSGCGTVGGLAGYNRGVIQSCHATGSVVGHGTIGGLVGFNEGGIVSGCYASGAVSSIYDAGGLVGQNRGLVTTSYSTGTVNSSIHVGGLVGWSVSGTIASCYATGPATGSDGVGGLIGYNQQGKIFHSYSTGEPKGNYNTGGLCGAVATGGIYEDVGNYWDTETSLYATSAMGTGKTTAEMKTQSTFVNASSFWDFVYTWKIVENVTCPTLRSGAGQTQLSADLNSDGRVDLIDLGLFAEQWLLGT